MARVVTEQQNGRWLVLVDVSQYGGDELSIAEAKRFAHDVLNAAEEAETNNRRDNA
jgi:hypothetical protein